MNEEGEMRQFAISIGVILVFAVGMLLGLLASPAWGEQKEWKAQHMNESPPAIASEDTVHVERVSKAGKLDIVKLRGVDKKNSLMLGEYVVFVPDGPQKEWIAVDDTTMVERLTGRMVMRSFKATAVRFQGDKAVITHAVTGQKEEASADSITVHAVRLEDK